MRLAGAGRAAQVVGDHPRGGQGEPGVAAVAVGSLFAAPWWLSSCSGYREIGLCKKVVLAEARRKRAFAPLAGQEGHAGVAMAAPPCPNPVGAP